MLLISRPARVLANDTLQTIVSRGGLQFRAVAIHIPAGVARDAQGGFTIVDALYSGKRSGVFSNLLFPGGAIYFHLDWRFGKFLGWLFGKIGGSIFGRDFYLGVGFRAGVVLEGLLVLLVGLKPKYLPNGGGIVFKHHGRERESVRKVKKLGTAANRVSVVEPGVADAQIEAAKLNALFSSRNDIGGHENPVRGTTSFWPSVQALRLKPLSVFSSVPKHFGPAVHRR